MESDIEYAIDEILYSLGIKYIDLTPYQKKKIQDELEHLLWVHSQKNKDYDKGYDEGYKSGYDDGYEEGSEEED